MKSNNELRQKQIYVNYNRHFQTSKTISVNMVSVKSLKFNYEAVQFQSICRPTTSLKLYFFTRMFQRFCRLLTNNYFSLFQTNFPPIKKPVSWLLPAKCMRNTGESINFF